MIELHNLALQKKALHGNTTKNPVVKVVIVSSAFTASIPRSFNLNFEFCERSRVMIINNSIIRVTFGHALA